ncbi:hypothetical protein CVT25_014161 [Psilocybe cyanescens]|uniref:Uncharacterized protein n=1 Tax=Psilocybe cyanescens TaxID=93625 RepID=A0A409XUY0_PSICY|nr:hypothetical protein CVT25_014161 [Psilocybe cyanescens]
MCPKVSNKPASLNRRIVISTISVLYLLCFFDCIVEWYYLDWVVVINGDTRESIFFGKCGGGSSMDLDTWWLSSEFLIDYFRRITGWSATYYHVSFINILTDMEILPRLGTIAPGDLSPIDTFGFGIHEARAILGNNITSALTFVSLGTTVITTFFIGYRIYSATRLNGSPSRLFNRTVAMIIESAAAYSLVLLLDAIIFVLPSFNVVGSSLNEANSYVGGIVIVVTNQGMAPTFLVARIALTDPNSTVESAIITHISGSQFGSQQGSGSGRSGNATGDVGVGQSAYARSLCLARLGMLVERPRSIALRARCVPVSDYESVLAHKPCTAADTIYSNLI